MQVIKEHQLFPKYTKCEFWLRYVAFLFHFISSKGVVVYRNKAEVLRNWDIPLSPNYIRSFLGLAGYYTRYVDGFASIVYALTFFTKNKMKFEWLEECGRSFPIFKYRLTTAPVMTLPEGTKGFEVYSDASRVYWIVLLHKMGRL